MKNEKNTIKIDDRLQAIRPPDGYWEIYEDGAEGPAFTLPGTLTARQVKLIAAHINPQMDRYFEAGRRAGERKKEQEVKNVMALVLAPIAEPLKALYEEQASR